MKAGFSLVELTLAMAITLVVAAAIFSLVDPAASVFQVQPEVIDQQQRLRMSLDAIARDLKVAGAGFGKNFAAVLPARRGPLNPDPAGTYFADRVSILYAPPGAAETTLSGPSDATLVLAVNAQPGCAVADPLCGFGVNGLVAVFDDSGAYDVFRVSAIQASPPALVRAGGSLSRTYAASTRVVQVVSSTYSIRVDGSAGTSDLMHYDGRGADLPLADGVTALAFEYFGDPAPPVVIRDLAEAAGPWTSYGPRPPGAGVDDPETPAYGAGENCLFVPGAGWPVARPELEDLGPSPLALVTLDAGRLVDGPWCPDPASPNRFDADLLRVRRVRVTLRVRAMRTFLHRALSERQLTAEVDVRNMSLPR